MSKHENDSRPAVSLETTLTLWYPMYQKWIERLQTAPKEPLGTDAELQKTRNLPVFGQCTAWLIVLLSTRHRFASRIDQTGRGQIEIEGQHAGHARCKNDAATCKTTLAIGAGNTSRSVYVSSSRSISWSNPIPETAIGSKNCSR